MNSKWPFRVARLSAIVLLFIVSLNALAAGYSFITDPSGNGLGITTAYLRPTAPFADYLIPGLVLFLAIGIGCSLIAVLAIVRKKYYPALFVMQGCLLVGWIAVQLTMVTAFHPLHMIIALTGVFLIGIGFLLMKGKQAG